MDSSLKTVNWITEKCHLLFSTYCPSKSTQLSILPFPSLYRNHIPVCPIRNNVRPQLRLLSYTCNLCQVNFLWGVCLIWCCFPGCSAGKKTCFSKITKGATHLRFPCCLASTRALNKDRVWGRAILPCTSFLRETVMCCNQGYSGSNRLKQEADITVTHSSDDTWAFHQ